MKKYRGSPSLLTRRGGEMTPTGLVVVFVALAVFGLTHFRAAGAHVASQPSEPAQTADWLVSGSEEELAGRGYDVLSCLPQIDVCRVRGAAGLAGDVRHPGRVEKVGQYHALQVPEGGASVCISAQWHHYVLDTLRAWAHTSGAGVRIAILDTGVGPIPDIPVLFGKSFVTSSSGFEDVFGHGTHVAGLAAGRVQPAECASGMAPSAEVIAGKVLDDAGNGDFDQVAAGVIWAADQGAKVINMSLGGEIKSFTVERALAYAKTKGVVLVCAAGNNGSETPIYPGAYDDCLSVAATDRMDVLTNWSNRGKTIDVGAPGDAITSTCIDGSYCTMSGTSMSSPIVAGLAARSTRSRAPQRPASLSRSRSRRRSSPTGRPVAESTPARRLTTSSGSPRPRRHRPRRPLRFRAGRPCPRRPERQCLLPLRRLLPLGRRRLGCRRRRWWPTTSAAS